MLHPRVILQGQTAILLLPVQLVMHHPPGQEAARIPRLQGLLALPGRAALLPEEEENK